MPRVGLLAGGYGVGKRTASHLLGAESPMVHHFLISASGAVKIRKNTFKNSSIGTGEKRKRQDVQTLHYYLSDDGFD